MLKGSTIQIAVAVIAIFFSAAVNSRAQATFVNGDFVTLRQVDWDTSTLLQNAHPFATVFPTALQIGIVGVPGRYSILLTNGPAVQGYVSTGGTNVALTAHHINPTFPWGGQFGGELTALHLNIGFDDAEIFDGTLDIPLGDLSLANLGAFPGLDGMSVRDFASLANRAIGGDATGHSLDNLTLISAQLNAAFLNRVPSDWAQEHLRVVVDMRGDFNQNGTVDAADYVVWRKTLGQTDIGNGLAADGDGDGDVDANDYNLWRAAFGNTTLSAAAQAAVPEPTTIGLALLTLAALAGGRRRVAARSVRTSNH